VFGTTDKGRKDAMKNGKYMGNLDLQRKGEE